MSDFSNISLIECNSSNSYENNSQELASFNKSLFPYNSLIASEQSNNLELEESFNYENENQNINENSHSNNIFSNQDNNINNESNSSNNKTSISFLKKGKPGRKKNSEAKRKRREHDKFAKDNIKRKIQVHYLKFLRNLLNHMIKEILSEYKDIKNIQFYPLNYNFAKDVRKKTFNSLKNTTIGNIFKDNVSPKYKNYETLNKDVYNKVTKISDVIRKILDELFLEYFIVYYLKIKKIDLSKYGLDKYIILSDKMGFYTDLIKESEINSEIYHNKIEKCIKKDFIDKPIFVII